jgi:hypothetical protein
VLEYVEDLRVFGAVEPVFGGRLVGGFFVPGVERAARGVRGDRVGPEDVRFAAGEVDRAEGLGEEIALDRVGERRRSQAKQGSDDVLAVVRVVRFRRGLAFRVVVDDAGGPRGGRGGGGERQHRQQQESEERLPGTNHGEKPRGGSGQQRR